MSYFLKQISSFALISLALFSSCGSKDENAKVATAEESSAVCIWDKTPLVDKPSHKEGKWLSSISLGEKLKYLDESKEDNSSGKARTYYKVKLLDEKEGWVQGDFVSLQSTVATVVNKSDIYSRPDLSTLTKISFEPMDIIAIKSTQGDWTEVVGKRRKGTWIDKGWIKNKGTSSEEKDVAVAMYVTRALLKANVADVVTELKKIKESSDLSGSVFDTQIAELLSKLETPQEVTEDETPMPAEESSSTDTVYVK
jgi:hypothetical protein